MNKKHQLSTRDCFVFLPLFSDSFNN